MPIKQTFHGFITRFKNDIQREPDPIPHRKAFMLIQGLGTVLFTCLTIWLASREIPDIFHQNVFWALLLTWAYVNFTMFLSRWSDANKKTTDEKIDELISEIREKRRIPNSDHFDSIL
jgi:hypothetical protein